MVIGSVCNAFLDSAAKPSPTDLTTNNNSHAHKCHNNTGHQKIIFKSTNCQLTCNYKSVRFWKGDRTPRMIRSLATTAKPTYQETGSQGMDAGLHRLDTKPRRTGIPIARYINPYTSSCVDNLQPVEKPYS